MSSSWSQSPRYPHHRPNFATKPPTQTSPPPPLGKLLRTIEVEDLEGETFSHLATISNVKTVASYSWVDKTGPDSTILIPGTPPLWTPSKTATRLSEDSGTYFRDRNAARYPKHPMEPAVVACLRLKPDLPKDIDVVGCGSTIGNLLRFVRRQDVTASFRMLVEKVGTTVFLIRRENSPTEQISDVRGFGHAFPEANTTWEASVKGSSSHQRLIRYMFAGFNFFVRFEADGYIKGSGSPSPAVADSAKEKGKKKVTTIDSLAGLLKDVTVPEKSTEPGTGSLVVKEGGTLVDQQTIFDLKTRSIKSRFFKDHLEEQLPRLWISQIPNFILAFHANGTFNPADTKVEDVRTKIKDWEKAHSQDLTRLAALINDIIDLVTVADDCKLELRCAEMGKLEVRSQLPDAGDVLSPELADKWKSLSVHELARRVQADDSESECDDVKAYDTYSDTGSADLDYTACSAHDCGYCGKCPY
ncbi:hypothetical protein QBC39DRAFT_136648 [Podospora conica]|nr:hypothetical protein QBC39DRAFT_136648 [Schizothecium conicum]